MESMRPCENNRLFHGTVMMFVKYLTANSKLRQNYARIGVVVNLKALTITGTNNHHICGSNSMQKSTLYARPTMCLSVMLQSLHTRRGIPSA